MRLLLFASAFILTSCGGGRVAELERENVRLTEQLQKASNFDRQQQCAAASRAEFEAQRWVSDASFTDHFNKKMNRCFILVMAYENRKPPAIEPGIYTHTILSDVMEKTTYARSVRSWNKGIVDCRLIPPNMPEKTCTTGNELDAFVKPYMEQ